MCCAPSCFLCITAPYGEPRTLSFSIPTTHANLKTAQYHALALRKISPCRRHSTLTTIPPKLSNPSTSLHRLYFPPTSHPINPNPGPFPHNKDAHPNLHYHARNPPPPPPWLPPHNPTHHQDALFANLRHKIRAAALVPAAYELRAELERELR